MGGCLRPRSSGESLTNNTESPESFSLDFNSRAEIPDMETSDNNQSFGDNEAVNFEGDNGMPILIESDNDPENFETEAQIFNVNISVLGSENFVIEVNENNTIIDLKKKIEQSHQLAAKEQRILYQGKVLKNSSTIPPIFHEETNQILQLIPYPNMKPSGDLVIKDVDEEIRLLMDNSIADVFNTLDNVPNTIQRFLIDMLRKTMNDFDKKVNIHARNEPYTEERFPDNWEINIEDMGRAVSGCEEISLEQLGAVFEHCYELLEDDDADLTEMGQIFSTYGTILSSLGRLCCRVHPNAETGELELRRGVNVEQVMVVQMFPNVSGFDNEAN